MHTQTHIILIIAITIISIELKLNLQIIFFISQSFNVTNLCLFLTFYLLYFKINKNINIIYIYFKCIIEL